MDPQKLCADERHGAYRVFCSAEPTTREHVVSRILLDDPLPENLPLVYSCQECNNGFSSDEEYLACLIDCVVSGSTDHMLVQRQKVRASLRLLRLWHAGFRPGAATISTASQFGSRKKPECEELL
jgi:hypothetical protein